MSEHSEDEHVPEPASEGHEVAHFVQQEIVPTRAQVALLPVHQGRHLQRQVAEQEADEDGEGEDDDGGGGAVGTSRSPHAFPLPPKHAEQCRTARDGDEEGDEEIQHHESAHEPRELRRGEADVGAIIRPDDPAPNSPRHRLPADLLHSLDDVRAAWRVDEASVVEHDGPDVVGGGEEPGDGGEEEAATRGEDAEGGAEGGDDSLHG